MYIHLENTYRYISVENRKESQAILNAILYLDKHEHNLFQIGFINSYKQFMELQDLGNTVNIDMYQRLIE